MAHADVPPPGDHGGDAHAVARALGVDPVDLLDLSASLNPVAPNWRPLAVAAIEAGRLDCYPDASAAATALAESIGVDLDRLVVTNGGSEAIALVAALHPEGWVDEPEFSLYARHLASLRPGAPRWRSNPNNPLGTLAPPDAKAFVWDEAFWPLASGTWTRGDGDAWRIGSLTKLWACPGLRLGYVIAPSASDAARLAARQPAWAVNGLALALVESLLARTDLPAWAAAVAELRRELADALERFGFSPEPSAANWVLVPGLAARRPSLARHGVLVRDCASFGRPGVARIAVPDRAGRRRLEAALAATAP